MSKIIFSFVLCFALAASVLGQTQTFTDPNVEYTFDLPDPIWKIVVKPSATSPNVEYAYADRLDGHLEIRKFPLRENEIVADIVQRDQEQRLQFIAGYVSGKEETFAGAFKGKVFNYEFVRFGKTMSGRVYYLKADDSTVYALRFTGLRDKLRILRNQTDSIARTFDLKKIN